MKRFHCLQRLAEFVGERLVVTTIGPTRSEWEFLHPSDANLYQSQMGTVTAMSLGLALGLRRNGSDLGVIGFEGDGSLLFAPGIMATVANLRPAGLTIVVFDNGCYESTGGQPTASGRETDIAAVARGFGLATATTVHDVDEFADAAKTALASSEPGFIVAKVEPSAGRSEFLAGVGPSTLDPMENKYRLARYIEKQTGARVLSPPEYASGFSPSVGRN